MRTRVHARTVEGASALPPACPPACLPNTYIRAYVNSMHV